MIVLLRYGLPLLLALCSIFPASAIPLEPVMLYGQNYINLKDWAEAKDFDFRWKKPDTEIRLTNRWASIVLNINSRKAEINDVTVWLSYAVAARNGSAFIAKADLITTLDPLLFPRKLSKGQRIKTVALCPGHGGRDPGFQVGSKQEKTYTLLLAEELNKALTAAGLKVIMLRSKDDYVGLEERPALAKKKGADIYVSLHYNCSEVETNAVRGVEVYCLTPAGAGPTNGRGASERSNGNHSDSKNILLAFQIQKAITRNLEVLDRGVRRAGFVVLRQAAIPAVLIEGGFMSHPADAKRIYDPAHRKEMAKAILDGILAYKRILER